jgi:hypothetical protein
VINWWPQRISTPGNHDIARDVKPAELAELRGALGVIEAQHISKWLASTSGEAPPGFSNERLAAVLSRGQAYRDWLKHTDLHHLLADPANPGKHPRFGYRCSFTLAGRPTPIHVIGLDSAWLSHGHESDHEKLLVTTDQIDKLCAGPQGERLSGWRVALAHHPLSDLYDGQEAEMRLGRYVDLFLHGHLHRQHGTEVYLSNGKLLTYGAGCLFESNQRDWWWNGHHVIDVVLNGDGKHQKLVLTPHEWNRQHLFWGALPPQERQFLTPRPGSNLAGAPPSVEGAPPALTDSLPYLAAAPTGPPHDPASHPTEVLRGTIEAEMNDIVNRYGKIGLLVDDAIDAESRVARELYATEDLPPWWCIARCLNCARHALGALRALLERGATPGDRPYAALIVDRYLPASHGANLRTIALDRSGDAEAVEDSCRAETLEIVRELYERGQRGDRLVCELVSSYTSHDRLRPPSSLDRDWKPRRIEPIRRLRAHHIEARAEKDLRWRGLLRRGPDVPTSPWQDTITTLAAQLARVAASKATQRQVKTTLALVTAWGASEAHSLHGPGLRRLDMLRAEWARVLQPTEEAAPTAWRSSVTRGCVCSGASLPGRRWTAPRDQEASPPHPERRSILTVLRVLAQEGLPAQRDSLHAARCRLFGRDDVGFAYQHWLMAQLPLSGILTLNFDHFHERAALAPSADSDVKLGTPVGWGGDNATEPSGSGALYKLLGDPFDPGTPAATLEKATSRFFGRMTSALKGVFCLPAERRVLAVIGASRSEMTAIIGAAAERLTGVDVLWVDETARPGFEVPVDQGNAAHVRVETLQGGALDFVYDLWAAYREELARLGTVPA